MPASYLPIAAVSRRKPQFLASHASLYVGTRSGPSPSLRTGVPAGLSATIQLGSATVSKLLSHDAVLPPHLLSGTGTRPNASFNDYFNERVKSAELSLAIIPSDAGSN